MKIGLIYNLNEEQEQAFFDYFYGKINSRELGEKLEISHQGAINMTNKVVRDWIKSGKYKLVRLN